MASTSTGVNGASRIEERIVCKQLIATQYVKGPGWKSYTPTVTGGTIPTSASVNSFRYRIVDGTLEIAFKIVTPNNTGGASSAGYVFSLPSGAVARDQTSLQSLGMFQTIGATKSYQGIIWNAVSPLGFAVYLTDPTSATPAVTQWGNGADAEVQFTAAGGNTSSGRLAIELDPACAILAGTQ